MNESTHLHIDILTVVPEQILSGLHHSIVGRAIASGIVTVSVINIRDFTEDRHKTTDDTPYGGGGGMVMKVEPIEKALTSLQLNDTTRIALTDPRGKLFTQETARAWAAEDRIVLICGHYEGVDDRVRQHLVTDEVSIGDFILTGGELPALVIVDALTRLQSGALGDEDATNKDSFSRPLLEYPHYTRPREFNGWEVPEILLCGHHAQIERWRLWHQLQDTRMRRPDIFAKLELTKAEIKLLTLDEPQTPIS